MYKFIRPLLFLLDAERSHELALGALRWAYRVPGVRAVWRAWYGRRLPALPVEAMGLRFPNPLGLAAGLDKNARCVGPLMDLGFGWVEVGTVTPRAQVGNPKPRLFRLTKHGALINRMGFNNHGVDALVATLQSQAKPGIVGVNIGKNRDTPPERALEDYLAALQAVYPVADYVAINISSPNTPGLRGLQAEEPLAQLLSALKAEQAALAKRHQRYVPLALKIAPDLSHEEIAQIARLLLNHRVDGVIATNTTLSRDGVADAPAANEGGGLSGRPLARRATQVIAELYRHLQGRIPIIGVGGINTLQDILEKRQAGADLVQVYTGLIYQGPGLVRRLLKDLATNQQ